MKYLKCRKNVKRYKNAMEKDLLGIRYVLNDYIESENDFLEIMKVISCKELLEVSEWIDCEFLQMSSTSKSALLLGISEYKKDSYSYKYASLQLSEMEDSLILNWALMILCFLFASATLMVQIWSITDKEIFLAGGLAILLCMTIPRLFPRKKHTPKSREDYKTEKMILRERLSSVKYDVAIVESEIKHVAYRYWNTSILLGSRHHN